VQNQLHALARNQGLLPHTSFWTRTGRQQLESLALDPWAHRRRQDLLCNFDHLNSQIDELTEQVRQQARQRTDTANSCSSRVSDRS